MTLPVAELALIERAFLAGFAARDDVIERQMLYAMPDGVTPRELAQLRVIQRLTDAAGYPPTLTEVAVAMEVSKVTVFERAQILVRKRCLTHRPFTTRAYTVAVALPPEREPHR